MAGYGKNSRGGKRGSSSSSSSSYVSTTTMLLVLACCVFAVYMLTSSYITPPHATPASSNVSHHHLKRNTVPAPPRTILRDSSPATEVHEDTQGDLPDEAVKGHHESISSANQEDVTNDSAGTEEDSRSEVEAVQHEKQQQEDVETNPEKPLNEEEVETRRNDEEVQHDQSDVVHEQQQQQQQQHVEEDQAREQPQQQHEEMNQNQDDEQQQNDAVNGQSNEEQQQQNENEEQQQQQKQSSEHQQQYEQHGEEQSSDESQQQQQQSETNGEEGHQDETNSNESQQQSVNEIDDNHGKNLPQIIQQVTGESNSRSEEGEGISSQSQIEHDTDGTTEQHQQQQQQEQQEQKEEEQQQQHQEEEEEEQQQQQQQQQEEEQQQQEQQQQQDSLQPQQTEDESNAGGSNENNQPNEDNVNVNDSLPDGGQSAVPIENKGDKKTWATQADQSSNEKERRKGEESSQSNKEEEGENGDVGKSAGQDWELCNVTAGPDYIPCLDNEKAIKQLRSFRHFEHRERHCPEESPTCLVPLPKGYKRSIQWPQSRDRIWYNNVPRTKLAEVKGHQNWVKVTGEYLTFPGGGTQFIHGALHYIDFIQQSVPEIAWGKHTRVILDVGCGVASFGGYLFERDVLAMSFAPKDEHEAQVQFALERGIPAISAVMGSQRLPFPSRVFDIVHCARCRVPWHANDGALLLELNRVLRPGGFFVWSATPVYQKLKEDVEIWEAMTTLTKSMCWELFTIKKDKLNSVGAAMYRKPVTNDCYENRNEQKPPMCKEDDDPNAAWYVPLQSCMHRVPVDPSVRGSQWPLEWPRRAQVPPYWLNSSQMGVYGRPAPDDFTKDYQHWRRVVNKSYLNGFGIDWSRVRNVMDMRAVYGGFAAALKDMKVWVMNLVNIDSPDTLPIIYERGLFGMYHDWCESFSTYPRTYDLLHADHLFSQVRKRCKIVAVVAEVDRITRPGGKVIVRDESEVVGEVENLMKSLHWEIRLTYSRNNEGILCAEKSDWRPHRISSSFGLEKSGV